MSLSAKTSNPVPRMPDDDSPASVRKVMATVRSTSSLQTLHDAWAWAGQWNVGGDVWLPGERAEGKPGIIGVISAKLAKHGKHFDDLLRFESSSPYYKRLQKEGNPSPGRKSAGEQKMTFEKLHEPFKAWLSEVASEHGKSVEQVFGWWREYTRDCRNYDQSPVQSEFLDWYRDKLSASGGENPSPSARSSCGSLGGRGNPMGLHTRLVMAATDYDRKQGGKRGYNRYALAQYLGALQQAEQEIAGGSTARQALVSNFSGRLLDALLKAAGEPGAADEEVREAWNSAKSARGSSNPGERPVFIRKGRDIGRVLRWEGDKPVVRFAGDPNYDYRVSGGWRPAILSDFGELNKKGVAIGKRQTLGNFEREFAGTAIGYVYPPPYPRAMKGNPEWPRVLEFVDTTRDQTEAREVLDGLKLQDGFVGGRILPPSPATPTWRVQAFFQDVPGMTKEDARFVGLHKAVLPPGVESQMERNPNSESQSAAALYEQFHGRPSSETLEYREEVEFADDLAALGDLVDIVIATLSGYRATLVFPESGAGVVKLSSTGDGKQLHLVGGEQDVELEKIHMNGSKWLRDKMVLGQIEKITYRTRKAHDNYKDVEYFHHAGEETGERPYLLYDSVNKALEIAGGQYHAQQAGLVN